MDRRYPWKGLIVNARIDSAAIEQICSFSYLVHLKYTMDAIKQVYDKVKSEYGKNITNKLKMVDALAVYALVTAVVQVKKA